MGKRIFHVLLIIVVGFLVYSNTFHVPFHFDDAPNIVENYSLRDLNNFWPPSSTRWLGFLSFALNYHFGGLNTIGYHVVNLTIHIFNAILVYLLVILTFKTPFFSNQQSAISSQQSEETNFDLPIHPFSSASGGQAYLPLFIALIFVSHPIQTQAVTYIVQRFTSLATFFYLLSLVMYIKWKESKEHRAEGIEQQAMSNEQQAKCYAPSAMLYAVSLFSAILAMKTKEISFTLPIIIVLYEFMFFEGNIKKRMLYLIPILLTILIIPLSLIGTDKPIGDAIGELREAAQETDEIPRWSYLFTQFRVIVTYIRLLVLPINQNLDYDYPLYHSLLNPEVSLSLLFLLLIFAFGIYLLYSKRYTLPATRLTAFGIFWFFITLSIESSIIPIRDVIFEHRVYLPLVGLFFAIIISIFLLADKLKSRWQKVNIAVVVTLAIVIAVLSIATYQRNTVWQDEVKLWADVTWKSPKKARGYNGLGKAYWAKGLTDKAIEHYHVALELMPFDSAIIHNNLGIAYNSKGLFDKAIEHYLIALRLKPDYDEAHNNIGNAYDNEGLFNKAIEHYQIALRLKPDYAEAHYNWGVAYARNGFVDEAIREFQTTLRLKPDFIEARQNLEFLMKSK